ncbi:arginine--tRNA ligase [Alicyclobacillus sp. SO9]|uniref:arginine--tRNA ligase n=1 Tax=Alicyclobacillus sp. SO9 TaxID=2665646 RepID=UPI0018E75191|nr:arginine--tRNA ligase [Alicyclobacillus sp. SO9]QQE79464.1 arginine--tRNA ligase [Alicyclobacillus sp. SO9]
MKSQKEIIADALYEYLGVSQDEVTATLEYPPQPELGDLALPCFRFAKTLRTSPQSIAAEAADRLQQSGQFEAVEVAGGFVNVHVRRNKVTSSLLSDAAVPEHLFSKQRHSGHTAAVDYSSPNIAKPFGVGHLRSTMIGQAIVRMLRADGFTVEGINHLGDWGTQFGKNIVAFRRWGDENAVRKTPVKELYQLYVRFHEEAKQHPELDEEARLWFKKLEEGDEEATGLWNWFIEESLKSFRQTYRLLGVDFDHFLGESFYNDKMDAVVEELREQHLLVESDGAEVVDLSQYNMPPCIIRKSDGATIYATRDLAAALYRHDVLGADHLIYVVGSEQKLHFAQIFKVLELMGREWASNSQHVSFGMMKYNGEKMSTRRGKIIYLEDVLQRSISEALKIIEEKNPSLENKEQVAEDVGVGAVIFNDLKTYRIHDADFRYEDVLNFDGETGPYVQYTHARACSVLRKAEAAGYTSATAAAAEGAAPLIDSEWALVHHLSQANEFFERAVDGMDPSIMARFVLDLCHRFNRFYHDAPILTAQPEIRAVRIALTETSQRVIEYALYLLGLKSPRQM